MVAVLFGIFVTNFSLCMSELTQNHTTFSDISISKCFPLINFNLFMNVVICFNYSFRLFNMNFVIIDNETIFDDLASDFFGYLCLHLQMSFLQHFFHLCHQLSVQAA